MPLYEFKCAGCGAKFEKLTSDAKSIICPQCGSTQVEKVFSTFSCRIAATATPSSVPSCTGG